LSLLVVMLGNTPPVVEVLHHGGRMTDADSGFDVLLTDAPEDLDTLDVNDPRVSVTCLQCLFDEHPGIGRGFDIAREHGHAVRNPETGEWAYDGGHDV
jgi:hypothetical protein